MVSKSNIVCPTLSLSADGSLGSVHPFIGQIACMQVSGKGSPRCAPFLYPDLKVTKEIFVIEEKTRTATRKFSLWQWLSGGVL